MALGWVSLVLGLIRHTQGLVVGPPLLTALGWISPVRGLTHWTQELLCVVVGPPLSTALGLLSRSPGRAKRLSGWVAGHVPQRERRVREWS